MSILTQTTTMPGSSFGLPARRACPGAFLSSGSVCSSCYADERRRYRWRTVKLAQERRYEWTLEALSSGRFVPTLVGLVTARRDAHFRLHDSGDFFSPSYVGAWREVALALPHVAFWAPTRSWAIGGAPRGDADPLLAELRRLALLPNVTVRPSGLLLDGDPPLVAGLHAGTAVTSTPTQASCPKYLHSPPACGDCRRCWDEPERPVVYLKH